MAIPAHGEHAAYSERRRSAPARLYLAHERLAIGGGTLVALLLAWEAVGRSGLVDPLFLPAPSQIAQAGWGLSHDADFWNDLAVSGREFILVTPPRSRSRSRSVSRSACPGACNTCWARSSIRSTRCRGSRCCR
jgi:hypothetical protein